MFVCTGNAARSVMAGAMMSQLAPQLRVITAGTHVIEGHPMSWRTRDAIVAAGFDVGRHRSRQIHARDLNDVDLIVALAGEHVGYIRRRYPVAASRTATLKRLCRDLPLVVGSLPERLNSLGLAEVELEGWEDVRDPAGGELPDFVACATEIRDLLSGLAPLLVSIGP